MYKKIKIYIYYIIYVQNLLVFEFRATVVEIYEKERKKREKILTKCTFCNQLIRGYGCIVYLFPTYGNQCHPN